MTLTALGLAIAMGFGMGLLGGGGSIVAVPALTFLLHFPPKDAVATSLAVVGLAAAAGALGGFLRGVLPLTIAITVGLSATVGAVAGGAAGARLSDQTQLTMLSIVMCGAAVAMWRPRPLERSAPRRRLPFLIVLGLAIGALTGLVGVGGGFLIVPALVLFTGLPLAKAAAASLFVITLSALAALPNYAGRTSLSWTFIIPFALAAGMAAIAGGMVAHRLPQRRVQQAFAVTLVLLASYVFTQA
jgi:uncharacterized membrane protein YfcA